MWGGKRKRRSDAMMTTCEDCDDDIDMEECDGWSTCGDCQCSLCSECAGIICAICDTKSSNPDLHIATQVINLACCESCIDRCDDCEDLVFHRGCLAEHLQVCNKKSRAERTLAAYNQTIKTTEEKLEEAKAQLARQVAYIAKLENKLHGAKEDKINAEEDSKSVRVENVKRSI
jgi:hypothetical protein